MRSEFQLQEGRLKDSLAHIFCCRSPERPPEHHWRNRAASLSLLVLAFSSNVTSLSGCIPSDGVFVVYLGGTIYFGEESASLGTLVKDLLSKSSRIVLDLGDVTYIDSGGLGTLVDDFTHASFQTFCIASSMDSCRSRMNGR